MSLSPGLRLGSYNIVVLIGRGGMGEVYRARDTRLERDVAIKVLPPDVAADPARLARFEREAKAVAALSHPNILAIHDFGAEEGIAYAVTELLEGETLRKRLEQGALPVTKAVDVTVQIARGLSAAHDRHLVHRDIKPENIFLTHGGQVKILDFGLAKSLIDPSSSSEDPTVVSTDAGTVLGTVGYMAPEQIRGQTVDARTDLFACGAVLYEMLTGARAFQRDTAAETMTAILKDEPPEPSTRRADLPPALDRIVRHCLEKDPTERFQSARDSAFNLQALGQATGSGSAAVVPAGRARVPGWRELAAWGLVSALAIATAVLAWRANSPSAPATVTELMLSEEAELASGQPGPGLVVSPDGSRIFFSGIRDRQAFVRPLDQSRATAIRGTDLGRVFSVSADGRWIILATLDSIKKASLVDGNAVTICRTATIPVSAAMSADGQVVFSMMLGLWIVSGDGGTPRILTSLDASKGELSQEASSFLPDGKTLLFTNFVRDQVTTESLNIATGERRLILDQGSGAVFLSTGHLLFLRDNALMAVPFDPRRLAVTGTPRKVLDHVRVGISGSPKLGVSSDGSVLAYGAPAAASLVWVSRTGLETRLDLPSRAFEFPRLSRDGHHVLFGDYPGAWVADLTRGGLTRVSSEGFVYASGDWSPDGSQVAYTSLMDVIVRTVDGTGAPRRLGSSLAVRKFGPTWSPDGKTIAFAAYFAATNSDIYVQPADGLQPPRPFIATPAYEAGAQFSPDGKLLSYASLESGRLEVYITPFPGPGPKWLVSTNGGTHARWSADGRELFYRNGDDMMAVPVTPGSTPSFGKPALLFRGKYNYGSGLGLPTYDVAPDGRFLMIKNDDDENSERPRVIVNWSQRLKELLAGK